MTRLIAALAAALLLAMPAAAQGTQADLAKTGGYTITVNKGEVGEYTVYCTGTPAEQSACFDRVTGGTLRQDYRPSQLGSSKLRGITGVPAGNFTPDIANNYRGNAGAQGHNAATSDIDITNGTGGYAPPATPWVLGNADNGCRTVNAQCVRGANGTLYRVITPGAGQRPGATALQPPSGGVTYGDRHRAQAQAWQDEQIRKSYDLPPAAPGQSSLSGMSAADRNRALSEAFRQGQINRTLGTSTGGKDK